MVKIVGVRSTVLQSIVIGSYIANQTNEEKKRRQRRTQLILISFLYLSRKICCIEFLSSLFLLVVRKPVKIIPNFRGCRFYTIIPKVNSCPRRILRICFTEPRVVWLWLCLFVVNIFISWTASEKRAYPCFIKSGIFSILVSKNKLLVGAAGGPKFTI